MRTDPHETAERRPAFAKNEPAELLFEAVNHALQAAGLPEPAAEPETDLLPLVYVVGAPRSGTTLMHQLIARHLPLGYIDNLVARFWLRPGVGIALSRELLGEPGRRSFELSSRHGVSEGPAGPHEFGYFWRHWLQLDESPTHHLDAEALRRVDAEGLAAALREIRASFGRPVLFKNVICGFHARFLTRLHRASLFVHITRDAEAVARSILQSRFDRYGSYETWWSLKPSTFPFAETDAVTQALRQANECRSEIEAELSAEVCALSIDYEQICAEPPAALEQVRGGLRALGAELEVVGDVPTQLQLSTGPTLPAHLEARLQRQVVSSG